MPSPAVITRTSDSTVSGPAWTCQPGRRPGDRAYRHAVHDADPGRIQRAGQQRGDRSDIGEPGVHVQSAEVGGELREPGG